MIIIGKMAFYQNSFHHVKTGIKHKNDNNHSLSFNPISFHFLKLFRSHSHVPNGFAVQLVRFRDSMEFFTATV